MIRFERCFVNENKVMDFERWGKCLVGVVFDHGFACFYEMSASEREKFLSRVEKGFYSSILRFEISASEVKREVGMTLVDKIGRRHTSSRVSKVVISDFSGSEIFRPRRRIVTSIDTKILLESTISALSLTISLWMISGREAKRSFSQGEEFTPEMG